ncbi:hypothetical protein VRU48_12745 [Pedobacter sp. KR3-3]|uniref:Carboxypeptidase regulatory-like domain-containing protein n=1 Tax=Pedobacter albus TaxID=3113905 RepID=A0ABU7I9E0_9SPHI|nr:hypothetical protein [Pedobacter sp. KR3-3]MEE1945981.1 hypothetical protein [Pedobacter sp. KR3-3]
MKKLTLCLTALICFLITSCKKDNAGGPTINPPTTSDATFAKNFGNTANRDFIGQVIDATHNPIPGVNVKIGSSTAQTDANGIFSIKNASVYEQFAFITATKTGYLNGSRALVPTTGTNNVKIMLLSATVTTTVNTGTTSTASLANGTKITFDGAFKTETGTSYTGAVSVIVNHLDPADANLASKMPGMLFAKSTNGDPKLLETYGMVNVELRGSAGEKLQPSNTAQIEFPITASQQGNAPATIPLWHFDETLGYWKEEGSATKTGNKYIGSVKHFSWWNVDALLDYVNLNLKIVDGSGNPLSNVSTAIVRGNYTTNPGYTNANGEVSGPVPKNETLTLNIINDCGTVVSSQTIGPFATNTTLPNIVANIPAAQTTLVSGLLKKCDNSNVTSGYVSVNYNGRTYLTSVSNGNFSIRLLTCSATSFTLIGQDLDNNKNTGTTTYTLAYPSLNVGSLLACNTSTESISYQIDNMAPKALYANISAIVTGNGFQIDANTPGQNDQITIIGNPITPGSYSSTSSSYQLAGIGLTSVLGSTISQQNITFVLTNVGAVGQYIDISFSGTYTEMVMLGGSMQASPIPRTISGTAHVIRDN